MRMVFPNNIPGRFFDELASDMNELVGTIMGDQVQADGAKGTFKPAMDVLETDLAYILSLDLPGVKFSDLQIEMNDGFLKIDGTRHNKLAAGDDSKSRIERSFGDFERKFRMPKDVDAAKIEADYEDGVLTITVPKMEKAEPTKIQVKYRSNSGSNEGSPE